jgi:hypothetical protein
VQWGYPWRRPPTCFALLGSCWSTVSTSHPMLRQIPQGVKLFLPPKVLKCKFPFFFCPLPGYTVFF